MEISSGSQQILLKQGVIWLNKRLNKLVDQLAADFAASPELPYHLLPSFLRKLVAKDMLQDLIKRLDSYSYDAEAIQKKMLAALKKGATMQSLAISINLMVATITAEAQRELADQPAMRMALLNKTEYFATLLKSTAATAAIEKERESAKLNWPK
jgi:hypothetical protein